MYGVAVEELKKIPEIVKIHYTTGKYNIFAKLYCKDTKHLKEILHDKIQQVEGIDSTETIISLERSMSRPLKL
jgi:Lrp/AsnC family transcriptional regulator for asnA, asnC and gidA